MTAFGRVRDALRSIRQGGGRGNAPVLIRRSATSPEVDLALRLLLVLLLIAAVFGVFLLDRGGLRDNIDGSVSVSDVFYFTMVTITTVGYGDIVPVSDQARLIDAFFVTPVRAFVWFIFLGTAYQFIFQRLIEEWRMTRLQQKLQGHIIVCGYGQTGSIAVTELLMRGWPPSQVIVIEQNREVLERAAERGLIGLLGNASTEELLNVAGVERAASVIVAVGRDDTTVLVVLTIRALSSSVRIIASVAEAENVKLVRSSGADVVVSPPRFGGFLMADAVKNHSTVDFVRELLTYQGGYQLAERDVRTEEIGREVRDVAGSIIVEVIRGGQRHGCWHDKTLRLVPGDRVLAIDAGEPRPDSLA